MPKFSTMMAVRKIRVEVDELETKKTVKNVDKTKRCLFENTMKIDKFLYRLAKKKEELEERT